MIKSLFLHNFRDENRLSLSENSEDCGEVAIATSTRSEIFAARENEFQTEGYVGVDSRTKK